MFSIQNKGAFSVNYSVMGMEKVQWEGAVSGSKPLSAGLADKSLKAHAKRCFFKFHSGIFRAITSVSARDGAAGMMQWAVKMESGCICELRLSHRICLLPCC